MDMMVQNEIEVDPFRNEIEVDPFQNSGKYSSLICVWGWFMLNLPVYAQFACGGGQGVPDDEPGHVGGEVRFRVHEGRVAGGVMRVGQVKASRS